jgi:hypothetical protein
MLIVVESHGLCDITKEFNIGQANIVIFLNDLGISVDGNRVHNDFLSMLHNNQNEIVKYRDAIINEGPTIHEYNLIKYGEHNFYDIYLKRLLAEINKDQFQN